VRGARDIEGTATRVGASKPGGERVSIEERERRDRRQAARSLSFVTLEIAPASLAALPCISLASFTRFFLLHFYFLL
jgi:hypothetical protein